MLNDLNKDNIYVCIIRHNRLHDNLDLKYKTGLHVYDEPVFWFTELWLAKNYFHLGEILVVVNVPNKRDQKDLIVTKSGFYYWKTNMIIFAEEYSLLNPKIFKTFCLDFIDYYPQLVKYSVLNNEIYLLDRWLKFSVVYGTSWVEKYKTDYAIRDTLLLSAKINRLNAFEWYEQVIDEYVERTGFLLEINFITKNGKIVIFEIATENGNLESLDWALTRFDKKCLWNLNALYMDIDWTKCLIVACKINRLDILECFRKHMPHRIKPKELVDFNNCKLPKKVKFLDKKCVSQMVYYSCKNENIEMLDFIKDVYGNMNVDISKAIVEAAKKGSVKLFSWFGKNMMKNFQKINRKTLDDCLTKVSEEGHVEFYAWFKKIEKILL